MTARFSVESWDTPSDDIRSSLAFDNRMAAADEHADWIAAGCPSADEWFADELLAMQEEPVEDPSRYASEAEYYDLGGLLQESCGPLLDDDLTTRNHRIVHETLNEVIDDLPGVLDPEIARELRARIRKAAA